MAQNTSARARPKGRGNAAWAAFSRPKPRFRGSLGARALDFWATCCSRGPLCPGVYKNPQGSSVEGDPEFRASLCNLVFRFVVVVVVLLLVVVLAIRVKERETV